MLIDWFTVSAQVVNFLILMWLLKRFLYKPILTAIDEREKRIADQIAQAEAKQTEANRQLSDFQSKTLEFDQQRDALLSQAKGEAKEERQKLLDEAHSEYDALRTSQKEALDRERISVSQQLVKRTKAEVFAIARKTLSDLASASLDESIANVFVQRLRSLTAQEVGQLTDAFKASPQTPLVHSMFDLAPPQRAAIESALKDTLGGLPQVRFETAPGLVSGIELELQGYKLSWSIADYLDSFEESVAATSKDGHAN
jgi:F-type H+-transporting ATPase subunit b